MNQKQESFMSAISACLVLFTSMLHPLVSVGLAVLLIIIFAIYKYKQSE
ncbi:hypothetical protein HGA88_02895 [Candidatus Roizmanbacteria bacterium]|nr:hypothetical protein [Candidatus Roizmanbacteria bacterium]